MTRSIDIRCLEPLRRDALEESARLALSFVAVATRPGYHLAWRDEGLRLTLSTAALHDGCYLPEAALQLLEAIQSYGVVVARAVPNSADDAPPEEWAEWWSKLPSASDKTFDLVLEMV